MKTFPSKPPSPTRSFDISRPQLLAVLATTLAFSGCTTPPVLRPPTANLRDGIGKVNVVALSNVRQIRFQVPDSKADVAAEKISFEVISPRDVGRTAAPLLAFGAPGMALWSGITTGFPAFMIVASPVAQEIRRAVCLLAADSAANVATARTTMEAAVRSFRFEEQLRARLASRLSQAAPAVPQVPQPRDADTILELMAYEPSISGVEGTNPGLALQLGLRIRLLDAKTCQELYYDYLDYRGSKHPLVEWAADDARVFHAELERCLNRLSTEIAAQLFLRPNTEVIDRSALAATGISRRPAQPLTTSAGTPWSPTYSPARYARR